MDEVRLKEIEKQFEYGALGTYSPDHWNLAHELITALRYEWAKRNKYIEETFANLGESEEQTEQQRERADRAEEEAFKWQESWKNEHALRLTDEMRFSSLREAAEVGAKAIEHLHKAHNVLNNDWTERGQAWQDVIDAAKEIRCALNAARNPVR